MDDKVMPGGDREGPEKKGRKININVSKIMKMIKLSFIRSYCSFLNSLLLF